MSRALPPKADERHTKRGKTDEHNRFSQVVVESMGRSFVTDDDDLFALVII